MSMIKNGHVILSDIINQKFYTDEMFMTGQARTHRRMIKYSHGITCDDINPNI